MKNKPKLGIAVDAGKELNDSVEQLTESGTWNFGDLHINRSGLRIGSTGPAAAVRRLSGGDRDPGTAQPSGSSEADTEVDAGLDPREIAREKLLIMKAIGAGTSGVAHMARHRDTGQLFVLKEIPFNMNDKQVRKTIAAELRTMYDASHPHIVQFHQSFLCNGSISILMEYMDGGTLADVLKRYARLSENAIAEIARQVLAGLVYLHVEKRIIHRDIKPSNLLLNSKGQVKIADFGVSSEINATLQCAMTWVGTACYMSPERIEANGRYSFKTDVWALGLTLVECALGHFPYAEPGVPGSSLGVFDLAVKVVNEPEPKLKPADGFSAEFCEFVGLCLRKKPEQRWSAARLLQHPFLAKRSTGPPFDLRPLAAPQIAGAGR